MGKTKSSDKTHYELLFVIPNKFTEEEAKGIDEKVQKMITDHEGEITYGEDWGNKKMAYPIEGFTHGYYRLHEFDLWGKDLKEINNLLRMSSDVIRHQIIKIAKRSAEEISKEKEDQKKIVAKEEEEKKAEEEKKEKMEEAKKEAANKKKVDLKDLDKKLDDILDSSDLL